MSTPTLYHSKLVQMGEVWVTVKTNPKPSTYRGKPPYVAVVIDGAEYFYNCENKQCEDTFAGQAGQNLLLVAEGREEAATITVIEALPAPAQGTAPRQQQRTAPAARTAPAQNRPTAAPRAAQQQKKSPEQVIQETQSWLQRRGLLFQLCQDEAVNVLISYKERHAAAIEQNLFLAPTPDMLQSITASLFIAADRGGMSDQLPDVAENDNVPM